MDARSEASYDVERTDTMENRRSATNDRTPSLAEGDKVLSCLFNHYLETGEGMTADTLSEQLGRPVDVMRLNQWHLCQIDVENGFLFPSREFLRSAIVSGKIEGERA
jgi:hypothetical protein